MQNIIIAIEHHQQKLNKCYENLTNKFRLLNSMTNSSIGIMDGDKENSLMVVIGTPPWGV